MNIRSNYNSFQSFIKSKYAKTTIHSKLTQKNEVLLLPYVVGTLVNGVFVSRSKTFYGSLVFGLRIKYILF